MFDEENIPGLSTMHDCNMVLEVKDIHVHYSVILVKYVFETKTFKWCEFTAVMVHPGSGQ